MTTDDSDAGMTLRAVVLFMAIIGRRSLVHSGPVACSVLWLLRSDAKIDAIATQNHPHSYRN